MAIWSKFTPKCLINNYTVLLKLIGNKVGKLIIPLENVMNCHN